MAEALIPLPFVSYAQNGEDVMLWRAFQGIACGFYVDVGAAFADEDSVTRAFYDRGWHGINIEAVPHMAAAIARARPRDMTLAVAAGAGEGTITLHVVEGGGLSTTDPRALQNLAALGIAAAASTVPVRPLRAILAEHAVGEIHFLKIDVEGAERAVLEGCDFGAHRPHVVLVEATRPMSREADHESWEGLLLGAGYRFMFFDGLNRFYVADEWMQALGAHFTTPVNVLDDYIRVSDAAWARRAAEQAVQAEQAMARARSAVASAEAAYARAFEQARVAGANRARLEAAEQARDEALRLRIAADAWGQACNARTEAAERGAAERDAAATQHIEALRHAVDASSKQAAALQALLDATHRSTSWRITRPLRAIMRRLRPRPDPVQPEAPAPPPTFAATVARAAPHEAGEPFPPPVVQAPVVVPPPPAFLHRRRAVHQFHSGSATGDAVTNCMLLIRAQLRGLGYRSEIFVQHRDPGLVDELRTLDELPMHGGHVLIIHHSMGHDALDQVLASSAPKLLYYHNITPTAFLPDEPALRRYAELGRRQLLALRDSVVAALTPSEFNALTLRQLGFPVVRVTNLLFDVGALRDRARMAPARVLDQPFTVLFVGRVIESKAQADLVEAFAAFRQRLGRPARLVLAGRTDSPGTYLDVLNQRIEAHDLEQAVVVTGPVSETELDAQYAAADLYVSLSLHEGFGVPLMEAVVRGIPVLAWPCGAVPYVMGGAGLLADRATDAVAACMLALATDPAERQALRLSQAAVLDGHALSRHWPEMQAALIDAGAVAPPDAAARPALAVMLRFAIVGHAQGSYSLAAVNRGMAAAIEAERPGRVRLVPVETVPTTDLSTLPVAAQPLARRGPPPTGPEIVVSQHYPVHVPAERGDLTLTLVFWEESLLPRETIAVLESFDAVLAPTRFVAKALVDSGLTRPVRVVGQAPDLSAFERVARERRPADPSAPFTFLHVSSCFPRKGIDVLLAAFARAFRAADPVRLVVKGFPNPHNDVAAQVAALRATDPDCPGIEVIDRDLDAGAMLDLYRRADAMALPTRGEGFNLPAAEAMAAGLPLIVTGFGGHLDFCDAETARLVAYQMSPSGSHLHSAGSMWAEPDVGDLVAALHEVEATRRDRAAAAALAGRAERARVRIGVFLGRQAFVRRLEQTSLDLLLRPQPAPLAIAWITSWGVRCGVAEYTKHLIAAMPPNPRVHRQIVLADDRFEPGALRAGAPAHARPAWQAGQAASMERLKAAIGAEDPDIVAIQHQSGLISWGALIDLVRAPVLVGRVVVATLHHTRDIPALPEPLRSRLLEALAGLARIIVHTIADVRRLHALGLADIVVQMPHGVRPVRPDRRATPSNPGAPLIGCYGFFLPGKGIAELIAALGILRQTWPGARLHLVNAEYGAEVSKQEIARCRAAAQAAGLDNAITWETRFLPDHQSLTLLAACDAIVVPTQHSMEASSAAVRTALAAGPPVLVTPLPLFEDVGGAVTRAPGTDPDGLAAGLSRLFSDPAAYAELGARAQAWVDANAWPAIAARTQDMLLGLLEYEASENVNARQSLDTILHP